MSSPMAIEKAPASRPATPAISTVRPLLDAAPTPMISARLLTRPSDAPNTTGRTIDAPGVSCGLSFEER